MLTWSLWTFSDVTIPYFFVDTTHAKCNVLVWFIEFENSNIIICHAIQSSKLEYTNANIWKYVLLLTIVLNYDDVGDGHTDQVDGYRGGNHEISKSKYQFYQLY